MSRSCDYYFLCDARIQESLSEGERGGGPTAEKQPQQHYFKPSTDFTVLQGRGGGQAFLGVQLFPGGGGGPDAYFHKNAYNL